MVDDRLVLQTTGAGSSEVSKTVSASTSTLSTSGRVPRWVGRAREPFERLASVGALPTPISTIRSTPSPPSSTGVHISSKVSIQRTGEANCHASSSITSVRASASRSALAVSQSARTSARIGEAQTSYTPCTYSRSMRNRCGYRLGM